MFSVWRWLHYGYDCSCWTYSIQKIRARETFWRQRCIEYTGNSLVFVPTLENRSITSFTSKAKTIEPKLFFFCFHLNFSVIVLFCPACYLIFFWICQFFCPDLFMKLNITMALLNCWKYWEASSMVLLFHWKRSIKCFCLKSWCRCTKSNRCQFTILSLPTASSNFWRKIPRWRNLLCLVSSNSGQKSTHQKRSFYSYLCSERNHWKNVNSYTFDLKKVEYCYIP